MSGILHKLTDEGGICEVAQIGTPWHGRVSQRVVSGQAEVFVTTDALVSGARVEHKLQSGGQNYAIPFCQYKFEKPGLPAAVTTAEEAALGMEWRKSAIIPMETGGDVFPFTDTDGVMWFRSANGLLNIGISGIYSDDPVSFTSKVVVMAAQVMAFEDPLIGSPPGVFKPFITSHLWADHAPGGADMNTGGAAARSVALDIKNNGRTVLMGAFTTIENIGPSFIFEINIIGAGYLDYDAAYGTAAPYGFSTSFTLVYTADECQTWTPPIPDTSYNSTAASSNSLNCAAQAPGSSGTINNSITYDEMEVVQRIIGAHYASDGSIVPVYLQKSTLLTGSGTSYQNWAKDASAPYDCASMEFGKTWDQATTVAHSIICGADVVDGVEYTYTTSGFGDWDAYAGIISLDSSGSFISASVGINLTYSGAASEGYAGNLPVFGEISHVTVPGSVGYYLYQSVHHTSAHVYGLVDARSESVARDDTYTVSYAIAAGQYYGFIGKGSAQAGAAFSLVSGLLGAFSSVLLGPPYYYFRVPNLNHRYTAYNPRNGEVAVLYQHPVWFI